MILLPSRFPACRRWPSTNRRTTAKAAALPAIDHGVELRVGWVDDAAEGPHGARSAQDVDPAPSRGQTRAAKRQGAAVELIEVGGRRIAYWHAGGGHPLVLLHSALSDGREWRPQLAGLPDEFDVIADPGAAARTTRPRRWAWPTTPTPSPTWSPPLTCGGCICAGSPSAVACVLTA